MARAKNLYYIDLWHGKCRDAMILQSKEKEAKYIFKGSISNWKKILKGELNPIASVMMGKMQMKGNMMYAMRQKAAGEVYFKIMGSIPVEF